MKTFSIQNEIPGFGLWPEYPATDWTVEFSPSYHHLAEIFAKLSKSCVKWMPLILSVEIGFILPAIVMVQLSGAISDKVILPVCAAGTFLGALILTRDSYFKKLQSEFSSKTT